MHKKLSRRGFLGASLGAAAIALAACTQSDKSEQAASTTEGDKEQRIVALNTGQLDNLLLLGITPVGVAAAKNPDLIPQARGDEAQAMLDDYEAPAAKVKDRQKNNPPTVSFLRTNNGEFQMYGAESMAGTVAADCGFARPQAQQFTDKAGKDLSAELIAEADADWLFYGVQKGSDSPADTSLWPTLKAVKNTQAIEIDYDSWYMNASLVSANVILDGLKTHVL
ncbi:MAG: ABC transporter substrate-binding protein [Corynebacterium casei]|uniref:ABC transporter substrate-binding protein n=1 Tax=Corynebacterium sp. TaxID=1720 RepID=UPI002648585E|nr:ABC transporter substrate-binding protein [Corynebacterium sp.]MDN6137970.1 ABC transporter substrate-binding protein [Corynebacterium sp.]MDN6740302.1 ABC transporter substrate-binding protein [Corynebacterium casei]